MTYPATDPASDPAWAKRRLALPHGPLLLREAAPWADGVPVLLLHGIRSGAGSWHALAAALPGCHLLAWDAPGYGHSAALPGPQPSAYAYAQAAAHALRELGLRRVLVVGHSLGAIMGTALVAQLMADAAGPQPAGLLLLSPTRGYAADPMRSALVRADRLQLLAAHGVAGLANSLSHRLLSAQASTAQHAQIQQVAQGLTRIGYAQAVQLLCGSDLPSLAAPLLPGWAAQPGAAARLPARVACGDADIVTPPAACAALAASLGLPFSLLPGAGHACVVEQAQAVAALITEMLICTEHPA